MIYSVGSFDDFSFEEAITWDVSSACKVHVLDHMVSNPRNKACGIHFHPRGLGGAHEPAGSDLKSLADIFVALSHKGRTIDVLKIDCEGCEWNTYGSWFDANVSVDEMLVEIRHAGLQHYAHREGIIQPFSVASSHKLADMLTKILPNKKNCSRAANVHECSNHFKVMLSHTSPENIRAFINKMLKEGMVKSDALHTFQEYLEKVGSEATQPCRTSSD